MRTLTDDVISNPEKYDEEFWMGLFSWLIVPGVILFALVISAGIETKHFIKLVEEALDRLRV